jgi:hypothetical protein
MASRGLYLEQKPSGSGRQVERVGVDASAQAGGGCSVGTGAAHGAMAPAHIRHGRPSGRIAFNVFLGRLRIALPGRPSVRPGIITQIVEALRYRAHGSSHGLGHFVTASRPPRGSPLRPKVLNVRREHYSAQTKLQSLAARPRPVQPCARTGTKDYDTAAVACRPRAIECGIGFGRPAACRSLAF